ncbi:hypothetical protein [Aquibacillus halophilus]|uniref:hypothetical protein n=1 Tax=Aquibacillus halophilus TaxID=930132 RepID=UPI00147816D9|nr:hypothetical protein [Aquibacillus halophilus]
MTNPEEELLSFQTNPNDFGKCSNCGKLLTTPQEQKMTLCKECQRRHKDKEILGEE